MVITWRNRWQLSVAIDRPIDQQSKCYPISREKRIGTNFREHTGSRIGTDSSPLTASVQDVGAQRPAAHGLCFNFSRLVINVHDTDRENKRRPRTRAQQHTRTHAKGLLNATGLRGGPNAILIDSVPWVWCEPEPEYLDASPFPRSPMNVMNVNALTIYRRGIHDTVVAIISKTGQLGISRIRKWGNYQHTKT